ncbi:AMP phosphorylase [Pyrococcus furiosus DSM 3638]|uniref:AMP phosphorylase n=3 Tax=Pyrococcus furiosus TaxID=2261 RepID=AMPPA_PYRFU|nr:AMP phosphorylase [Pyrococcus furiosus]Q8U0I2.1 RecName: Full=AMP phosphorylase; Short=AMPpase; AltName: Full=Nucleoside monophosphate phosphorylase; Short=NMP phosphorylase [Pyrococcus furiosus DSM 3638]AAL81731.1 thymidine phosphorylase [Pyrococcus furiosus DSM 3638]AFN05035.1 thymidine phosphorylase [Pyrococcus furiosus COM1]QEK79230.1 AMP phosphorylase [Pyrococcus furiosus DSM 3638]
MRGKIKILDIETGNLAIFINPEDAEQWRIHPNDLVKIESGKRYIYGSAFIGNIVEKGEIGISKDVLSIHQFSNGEIVSLSPAGTPESVKYIKKKMRGEKLKKVEIETIVRDIVDRKLRNTEISAFVSAIEINGLDMEEIAALTIAMAETGDMLDIERKPIMDIHSIGGVPGNKTNVIVVPIVAAAGLTIPKTSSRAITSAAGTADVVEVLTNVTLTLEEIKRIVEKIGACLVWGGALNLAPADDLMIHVERRLSLDPRGLMLASIMAKKYAIGSQYILIDIPTGKGAKVESMEEARSLARDFIELGKRLGQYVEVAITYGGQPIGYTVGPALEAKEALETLMTGRGPGSLVEKAIGLAGLLLEMGGAAPKGKGKIIAREILEKGKAYQKMREIIEEQGGDPDIKPEDIPIGDKTYTIHAQTNGYVTAIDNRGITAIAREAGAPEDKGAGIRLHVKVGDKVKEGDPLFTIHAESESRLDKAIVLARRLEPIKIEGMVLQVIENL